MPVKIFVIGKTSDNLVKVNIDDYLKRCNRYFKVFYFELILKKNTGNEPIKIKSAEAEQILKDIKPADYLILLDEKGKEFSSVQFATKLEKLFSNKTGDIIFLIGGPYGFDEKIYQRANEQMALSKMTFTHQMVRLIFAEQLYRAFTILNNENYHH